MMGEEAKKITVNWNLVVLGGTIIILMVVFLAYTLLQTTVSSPCETIFEQTSMQLGIKLKHLDTKGELILGKEKIQDLTERAQVTALNLKACCVVLDSGDVNPSQFLECKNAAGRYEEKLNTAIAQLSEAIKAQQEGRTEVFQAKVRQINETVEDAKKTSDALQKQVDLLRSKPMEPDKYGRYLWDDFTTAKLSPAWEIVKPDPLRWQIQPKEGSLLIITQKGSIRGESESLKNQFLLNTTLPQENYEFIVKGSIQIQGQQNSMSVALFQDNDSYLEIGFWGQGEGGYNVHRRPHFTKELQGQRNYIRGRQKGAGSVQSPETVYLKIERIGNQYSGYYAFGEKSASKGIDDIQWTKIGTHAWIDFRGRPALWADNGSGTQYGGPATPEVAVEFDYILIRKREP